VKLIEYNDNEDYFRLVFENLEGGELFDKMGRNGK